MTKTDTTFAGSIPELYDTYLVPLIFEQFASDIAKRAAVTSPETVLEVAAGSGVVTRALSRMLRDDAKFVVTDLNQPMLDHAEHKQGADNRITWQQADALSLPFEDAFFDVVVCQFGVMFFPDRVAGYREARRVLRPGGQYIFNVWDRIDANDFARIVTEAAATVFPNDPPQFLARTPHGYHDVDVIRTELANAGFSNISIETIETSSKAPNPRHPAVAYCQGTPLRSEIEQRDAQLVEQVTTVAAEAIAKAFGSGEVTGRIRGHVVTAVC